jgi:hypothetical protein
VWYHLSKNRKKVDKNIDYANNYEALPAAEHLFKVNGLYGEYEVNIQKMECSCRSWQLTGIPCRHACACPRHARIKPEAVVHKCALKHSKQLMLCHAVILECGEMNGHPVGPPKYDKQVCRPSKKKEPI